MDVSKKPVREQPLLRNRTNAERTQDKEKRKALFLAAYEEWGNVRGAVKAVQVGRPTYERWVREDPEFMRAVEKAKQAFGEYLEELALERVRNPDKNRGSDVLLLALLNANLPAKFRPQVALSEDSAKDLIIEWRQAAKAVRKEEERGDGSSPLPVSVEQTLSELLERRKGRPEQEDEDSVEG